MMKAQRRKHLKGQNDHVDAWLISYADLITLLFMLFVIFVSVSVSKKSSEKALTRGEQEHPYVEPRTGLLKLGTPYDEVYGRLTGIVATAKADQFIALEKNERGITIDISAARFFTPGTADIPIKELPVLRSILQALKDRSLEGMSISIEGHTHDEPLTGSRYANNWELSAMRATQLVRMLADEGVDPERLRAVSYGGNHPLVPNTDAAGNPIPENRLRNERIVIRVEKKAASVLS